MERCRLQDWLDGEIEAADTGVFETHVGECPICQQRLAQMEQLESGLLAATPHPTLDASFDARLFEKIDAFDDAQRAARTSARGAGTAGESARAVA